MTGLFAASSIAHLLWLVAGAIVVLLVLFILYDAIAAALALLRRASRPEPEAGLRRRGSTPSTSLGAKISPDPLRPWSPRPSTLTARFFRRFVPERRSWSEHRPNEPSDR